MADRRIKNISRLASPLPVHVRSGESGKDVVVHISSNEEFWCPNELDTNSLIVYARKGFLRLSSEPKPNSAVYYEVYPIGHWNNEAKKEEVLAEEKPSEEVATTVQRMKWEDKDIEFLKKNYPKNGVVYCAEQLERPKHSVKKKVEALGLKRENDKE